MGQKVMLLSDPVPKVMSLHVILKPSGADTRFCPSLCCVAEPVVCRGAACRFTGGTGKGGWGDTTGRPQLEEGPVGPSGRVKGEWLTCRKSETASQHLGPCSQEPPTTADVERAAEAEGQVGRVVSCHALSHLRSHAPNSRNTRAHGDEPHGGVSRGDVNHAWRDESRNSGRMAAVAWRRVPAEGALV